MNNIRIKKYLVLKKHRVVTGFLVSPLISCTVAVVLMAIVDLVSRYPFQSITSTKIFNFVYDVISIYLCLLAVSYALIFFLAIPCFVMLKKSHSLDLVSILFCSYMISLTGLFLPAVFIVPALSSNVTLFILFFPAHLITLLGAFVFWWIAIRPAEHQQ